MSFLKTLAFTSVLDAQPSPVTKKRAQLIANLKDQLSLIADPNHTKVRKQSLKENGERIVKERRTPVRPWWKVTLDGQVAFFIRSGMKKVEFEKGKSAIAVPSMEALPKLIDGLIEAVGKGELDHLLVPQDGQKTPARKKVA